MSTHSSNYRRLYKIFKKVIFDYVILFCLLSVSKTQRILTDLSSAEIVGFLFNNFLKTLMQLIVRKKYVCTSTVLFNLK